jgi:hypothetical protein
VDQPESREHFIPFRKADIASMCVEDGRVAAADAESFSNFCDILQSIIHFEFHERIERLKDLYAPFDPTGDTRPLVTHAPADRDALQKALVAELEGVLAKANYTRVSKDDLNLALAEESVFRVQLHTDLADFAELILFRRGLRRRQETVKAWGGLRKRVIDVDYFERVAIYVRFRDAPHAGAGGGKRAYVPGSTVLKLFQNIPRADLEMLFPNVDVRMKLTDRAMIGVPAVFGAIGILAKLGASLLVVWLVIAFWAGLTPEQPKAIDSPQLIALGLGVFTLVMYLIRQYGNFKNRKIKFMKALSDNLYFKNLDNNAGVFHHVIDAAEEEECKEAVLAYVFLRGAGDAGLTEDELDAAIEAWFRERWKVALDFEVDDGIGKLARLGIATERDGRWRAEPLQRALERLDDRWDAFFAFEPARA